MQTNTFEEIYQAIQNFNRNAYRLQLLKQQDQNVQAAVKLFPSMFDDPQEKLDPLYYAREVEPMQEQSKTVLPF